jgi:4'-phosphopantetheinyl transferase
MRSHPVLVPIVSADAAIEASDPGPLAACWEDGRAALLEVGAAPRLSAGDADLWLVALDAPACAGHGLQSLLSSDERERAQRFVFERDRQRFIAARGMLRTLLGRYVRIAPDAIRFDYGARGKPQLRDGSGGPSVQFNLSHSGGWALLGVTRDAPIGVDIEVHRDVPEAASIARSNFALEETRHLLSLPPSQRVQAFFECWTRKEAYIKALGDGLSMPLDRFVVAFACADAPRLVSIDGSREAADGWSLHHCEMGHGMTGAVALQAKSARFRHLLLA